MECTAEEICESDFKIKYYIDWDDIDSLENWVEKLDLMCVPEWDIYRISWVYYLGEIVGCLCMARIPDLFGRKIPLAVTTAIQFPVLIAIILTDSLTFMTVLAFFLGILHIGIYNGCYIDICEYTHTKWKNHVCTVLLVFDMVTVIIIGFYWRYISKNWLGLLIFAASLNGLSIAGMFLIPESPEYLYSFYRFNELREVIARIAKWNKADSNLEDLTQSQIMIMSQESKTKDLTQFYRFDTELDLKQIKFSKDVAVRQDSYVDSIKKGEEYRKSVEIQRSVKAGIQEFFKNPEWVRNLILNMALWALVVMNYQINDYYECFFPGDQFEFLMAISVVELIGYVVGGFVFESFKVKPATNLYMISFTICLVGSLGILLNDEEENPWLDLVFTFISKFGVAMAFQGVYLANVLFPIVFSSTTFGVCCMMGSTSAFVSVF